jgi:hypothetical protein
MTFQLFNFSTESSIALLIGIVALGIAVIVFTILAIRFCCCDHDNSSSVDLDKGQQNSGSGVTESLIPPLFYTLELRDPLSQADLRDSPLNKPLI